MASKSQNGENDLIENLSIMTESIYDSMSDISENTSINDPEVKVDGLY